MARKTHRKTSKLHFSRYAFSKVLPTKSIAALQTEKYKHSILHGEHVSLFLLTLESQLATDALSSSRQGCIIDNPAQYGQIF